MADSFRLCKKCNKPVNGQRCIPCRREYNKNLKRQQRKSSEFRIKEKAIAQKSYAKHRDKRLASMRAKGKDYIKNSVIKSTYGITLDDFNQMVKAQKGVCAICKLPERRKNRFTGITRLHIDHDHNTGQVRGLLCATCNFALGAFNDDVNNLKTAINYLNTMGTTTQTGGSSNRRIKQ